MRKHLCLLAAGALALTACTSEEVINDVTTSQNVIRFENVVNKNTRADITTGNLQQFTVLGYYHIAGSTNLHKEFDNAKIYRESTTGNDWKYDGDTRYWIPGATYYFYAVNCGVPSESDGELHTDIAIAEGQATPTVKIADFELAEQHDLIFASYAGDNYNGMAASETTSDPVQFAFKHILSKVKTVFTNSLPEIYSIKISNISISGLYEKATYECAPNTYCWTTAADAEATSSVDIAKDTEFTLAKDKSNDKDDAQAFVIPCTYDGEVAINFTVDIIIDNETVLTKKLTGKFAPGWQPGYIYVYNIDINGVSLNLNEIQFNVETSVSDWESEEKWNSEDDQQPEFTEEENN